MEEKGLEEKKISSTIKWIYDWVGDLTIYLSIIIIIMSFFFRIASVNGKSMQPTLYDGDRLVLISSIVKPQRGDIIVLAQPDGLTGEFDNNKVKRVIGVGGDEIDINYVEGRIYRNGEPLYEPYTADLINGPSGANPMTFPLTIPEGYLFVVGDNRNNSLDSRDEAVGLVDERYVLGKALFRFSPIGQFKVFENPEPVEKNATNEIESEPISSEE